MAFGPQILRNKGGERVISNRGGNTVMRKGHARRQLMLNHAPVQTHPSITVIQQSIHSPRLRKWYLFPSIKYISQVNQKIISYMFKKKNLPPKDRNLPGKMNQVIRMVKHLISQSSPN